MSTGQLAIGNLDPERVANPPNDVDGPAARMAEMEKVGVGAAERVEVVVAHDERATLRVGDVFVKIDADQTRLDVEVEAMARAPVPTPEVLWRRPPALALAVLPGVALRPSRRAGDRVVGGVGCGGCSGSDAARRSAAAMARSER